MQIDDDRLQQVLDPLARPWRTRPGLRDAAVLAPLFADDDGDALLFTQRRADLSSHAGEMSFPGGGREGNEDALACALRESNEEVGLDPAAVQVLGCLPERISIAGFLVHVFVGRIPSADDLVIDPGEVESIVPIPLAALRQRDRWEWRVLSGRRLRSPIPFFEWRGHTLWGLTAMLTVDLLERIDPEPDRAVKTDQSRE